MMSGIFGRVNTLLLILVMLLSMATIGILARRTGAGPLDPSGTPGPTLPQVEPRQPIPPVGWNGTFPIVISQPGSYFFTGNVTDNADFNAGITITSGSVTVDLNGFALTGHRGNDGIQVSDNADDVVIKNGQVIAWLNGISAGGSDRSRVENMDVSDNNSAGIILGSGAVVSHVAADRNQHEGLNIGDPHGKFYGGLVEDSTFDGSAFAVGAIVSANNVTLHRNVMDSNLQGGVQLTGAFDVLTDNTIQGTDLGPCVAVSGASNTIARNVISNCHSNQFVSNSGTNNHIGPATADLTSSQPWSNAEY